MSLEFTGASFNKFLEEKKLMGSRCQKCQAVYLPPRPLCPQCQNPTMEWIEMKGDGKLVAFTTVHVSPTFMVEQGWGRDNPYCT
ncbi:MAG: hypothetical protein HY664_03840, partial [Chloroflexi bacterium]|nr:hypothetical protein [Chloroflexota bacterium]